MAISLVGSAQGTTTVTVPAHQAGDLIVFFSYRGANTTPPTLPAGVTNWTGTGVTGANTNSMRVGFILATGSAHTSGTWTNASRTICHVYRSNTGTLSAGTAANGTGSGTSGTYPNLTLGSAADTARWVAGCMGHRVATTAGTATGLTRRQTTAGNPIAVTDDTNGAVTSFTGPTVTLGASTSGWYATAVEVIETNPPPATRVQPEALPGLLYRWRADSITTVANGATVDTWPALAGSLALTQATPANRPTYIASGINGQPVVRFATASSTWLGATFAAQAQPLTIVVVHKLARTAAPNQELWHSGPELITLPPGYDAFAGQDLQGGTLSTNATVLTYVGNGATSRLQQNGGTAVTGDSGTVGILAGVGRVGSKTTGTQFLDGDIAEILVYTGALTAAQLRSVHSYVQDRYGVAVGDYLAFSGQALTGTGADVAGAVDAWSDVLDASRAAGPDAAGAADAWADVLDAQRQAADVAGAVDAASALLTRQAEAGPDQAFISDETSLGRTTTAQDAAAATDAVAPALGAVRAAADSVGAVDGIAAALGRAASVADTAGATDAVTASLTRQYDIAVADTVAATDSAAALIITQLERGPDAAGAADAHTATQGLARAAGDTAGATDAATASLSHVEAVADTAAATDAIAVARHYAVTVADTVGAVDAAAGQIVILAEQGPDTAGAADAHSAIQGTARTAADTAGATDAVTVARTVALSVADSAAAVDAATRTQDLARQAADGAGAVDAASGALTQLTTTTVGPDAAGAVDAIAATRGYGRTVADTVAATDAIAASLARVVQVGDAAAVDDAVAASRALVRALADAAAVVDAVVAGRTYTVAVGDTAWAVDAATAGLVVFEGEFVVVWGSPRGPGVAGAARYGGVGGRVRSGSVGGRIADGSTSGTTREA